MIDFVRRNATNCVIKPGEEICHKQYHYSDVAIQHRSNQSRFVGARDDDTVTALAPSVLRRVTLSSGCKEGTGPCT
jgi:hypothetical protein